MPFAALDHLSGGRAGWNIVTTPNRNAGLNFGLDDHMEHSERYRRAHEFYQVVTGLWDTWADDAFIHDRENPKAASCGPLCRPELDAAPDAFIHEPWLWPGASALPSPPPIVEHANAAMAARDALYAIRKAWITSKRRVRSSPGTSAERLAFL